jgi:hypothetical protein
MTSISAIVLSSSGSFRKRLTSPAMAWRCVGVLVAGGGGGGGGSGLEVVVVEEEGKMMEDLSRTMKVHSVCVSVCMSM